MEAVVLAAGKGTRLKSRLPKVLQDVLGVPMLAYVLKTLKSLGIRRPYVVVGSGANAVCSFLKICENELAIRPRVVYQRQQHGTGHAVMMTQRHLRRHSGDILIWPGDMPLLQAETLKRFMRDHQADGSAASVLSALRIDPNSYGRILRAGGRFYAIREELDATDTERRIQEVNTGVYLFKSRALFGALKKIRPNNRKGEYYLTDVVEVLSRERQPMAAFPFASSNEGQGINSRQDLAGVMHIMSQREIRYHQEKGVTFVAPEQTVVAPGVKIGPDTVIYPWCYIESGVRIGRDCQIGPFAKIRKGSVIEDGAQIGSFVEIARSRIGKKVFAKHLTYLGDAVVGANTNVGAGTITANFDGKRKHMTRIGKQVLVGSDTVFVAPVSIGDRAQTGAGSVIKKNTRVKKGEVVVGVPARPISTRKKRS